MKIDPFNLFFEVDSNGHLKKDAQGQVIRINLKILILAPTSDIRSKLLGNISIRNAPKTAVVKSDTDNNAIVIITRCEGRFHRTYLYSIPEVVSLISKMTSQY